MRNAIALVFFALVAVATVRPLEAQEASQASSGFSLEVSVANVGIDRFEVNRLAIGVRPRWCPFPDRPWLCFWVDICRIIQPWPDPWSEVLGPDLPLRDLEVGPGWMLAPALEVALRHEGAFRPALYLGAGIQQTSGRTTDLGSRGSFTTGSSSSPMVMYGLNFAQDLSPRTTLRFQLGASTVFQDDLELTAVVNGVSQRLGFEGHDMTNGIVGVSLAYRFGG